MVFDWDEANLSHIARHGVSPKDVEGLFAGIWFDYGLMDVDGEERAAAIGEIKNGRILVVWYTWRTDRLRVVTAYAARKAEKVRYLDARRSEYGV